MEPQALQRGSIIDRYTVEGILGEGGMARVLRVRHNQLGTAHALKILTIHSPGIGERLLAEGRAQATLRHPNILSVTDALILDGGQPALILELVEGPSLDVLLHQRRLTLEQADALARGILAGVEEAHRHGLIHRDLKPANILLQPLDGGYQPKVADFGLVKILSGAPNSSSRTRTGSTMGTPRYMSPEQIRDSKNVDEASDVFALGAVLYELIAHEAAFGGADLLEIFNNVAASNYVPIRQHVPELPERMERAIEAALQPDPADRPASVQALAELWTDNQPLEAMPFPEVVRSLVSTPPAEEAPGSTWSGEPSRSGDSLSSSPSSQGAPSTRAAVALAGLGGGVLLLSLVGLLTVSGLAVGLWSVHSWLAPSEPTTTAISPQDPGGRPLGSPSTPPPGDPDEGETDRAITDRAITDSAITDSAITGGLVREDREERAGLDGEERAGLDGEERAGLDGEERAGLDGGERAGLDGGERAGLGGEASGKPGGGLGEAKDAHTREGGPWQAPALSGGPRSPAQVNRDPGSPTSPSTGPGDLTLTAPPNEVQFVEPRSPGQAQGGGHGAELEGLEAFELTTFLASDDPRERRRGLDNLVDRSDPQADRILGAFVRDDNDGSVRQHAWALVITRWDERLGNHGALQEIVGWQLAHGGERAAIEAARAMGRNGDRADLLAPGLRHPNHDVVLASIQAVQGVQRRSSDADWWSLIEPLTASSNPKVAALARELLRDTEPPPPARSDPRLDTATQQIQSGAE